MIIDAHCHAWRAWPYDLAVPDPGDRGSIEALLYEMDTHGVDRATVVCARIGGGAGGAGHPNEDNNDYVASFAAAHADRLEAWVDVDCVWRPEHHTRGAADRLTETLDRTGARGITHYVGTENDGWFRSDDGAEFFRTATRRGVLVSLAAGPAWYDDVATVARANPGLPILLHHLATPRRRDTGYESADLAALVLLAAEPNIRVKVSGFNYNSADPGEYPYSDSRELLRTLHGLFGADRLHWGSDFPASRDTLTYRQSLDVVRRHCDFLSERDLELLLGDGLATLLGTLS